MKTPNWAIVIGVCMMLLGGCSVTSSIQSLYIADMADMQKEMMNAFDINSQIIMNDSFNNVLDSNSTAEDSAAVLEKTELESHSLKHREDTKKIAQGFGKMFSVSDYAKKWTVRFGKIGLLVSLLYILSGAFILVVKPFSIKLAYIALMVSMVFGLVQTLVLTSDPDTGFIAKASGFGNLFSLTIDLVLIVVLLAVDKNSYQIKANHKNG